MRANHTLEIGTGLFVLLGFAALFFLTTQLPSSGLKLNETSGYRVTAEFDNVGDLKAGSPVSMAGVRIGEVETVGFNPKTYKAVATMRIDPAYNQIPDDSDASIQTQGLLGGKYVGIGPGGSDAYLKEGSQIAFTQSAIVLESLVNRFFANMANRGEEGSSEEESSESSPPADGAGSANQTQPDEAKQESGT
jgi:phospholipid/cholesterol/gamma-HCH transport system substrate-binding protein